MRMNARYRAATCRRAAGAFPLSRLESRLRRSGVVESDDGKIPPDEEAKMAYEMMGLSAEELAERLGTCDPGSITHTQIMSEIQRRHLFAQYEATEVLKQAALVEEKAARVSEIAAKAALQNTKYMLWSAMAAAASAAVSLAATIIVLSAKL